MKDCTAHLSRLALASMALFALTSSAFALPIKYEAGDSPKGTFPNSKAKRAEFLATLDAYGVDDLESFSNNDPDPTLSFGATGVTATTTAGKIVDAALFSTSGTKSVLDTGPAKAGLPGIPSVYTFSGFITAFGFYASQVGDGTNVTTFTFKLENTFSNTSKDVVFSPIGPGRGLNPVSFLGVTDTDPFNKVTISEVDDFDGSLWDDITIGYVPEPSTLALLAIGSVVVIGARRLRGRN